MPTITKTGISSEQQIGGVPYGNRTSLLFTFATNAVGAVVGSDLATGIAVADKVRFGRLPAGMRIDDALMIVSTVFTTGVTAKVGFEYVDGIDSTRVPQKDDYFGAAVTLAVAGRYLANNLTVVPVVLAKDAFLIVTTAGAANAKVARLDVLVHSVLTGSP